MENPTFSHSITEAHKSYKKNLQNPNLVMNILQRIEALQHPYLRSPSINFNHFDKKVKIEV